MTDFVAAMRRYRPCPKCGSERVNVSKQVSSERELLRVRCADCGETHEHTV